MHVSVKAHLACSHAKRHQTPTHLMLAHPRNAVYRPLRSSPRDLDDKEDSTGIYAPDTCQ